MNFTYRIPFLAKGKNSGYFARMLCLGIEPRLYELNTLLLTTIAVFYIFQHKKLIYEFAVRETLRVSRARCARLYEKHMCIQSKE